MSALPQIGLDIGSSSIKIAELAPVGRGKWKLLTAASMPSPEGSAGVGRTVVQLAALAVIKLAKEAGTRSRRVVAALPEDQVFTHLVEMPLLSETEIQQALIWQVEQFIPIPREQAVWSWDVVKRDEAGGSMEVMLVAVPKTLAEWYRQVMEQAGLEPTALETEMIATCRAVIDPATSLSAVVDIGARGSDMGMVRSGKLVFSRTIPTAGEAFTRAVESGLGLDAAQAEKYKTTYGFSKDQMEGRLAESMRPVMVLIAQEMRKMIDFYLSKHTGEAVKTATLTGGVAAMPDVVGVLSGLLGLEVTIANPFERVILDEEQKKSLSGTEPFYATVVGLAMKET